MSALNFISTTTKVIANERNTLTARQGIGTVSTQNQKQTKLLLENALATVSTDYSSIKVSHGFIITQLTLKMFF